MRELLTKGTKTEIWFLSLSKHINTPFSGYRSEIAKVVMV